MKKRGVAVLMAAFVLLAANMVTVFAKDGEVLPPAVRDTWSVSSYPGISGSGSCNVTRISNAYFTIVTEEYYSSGESNGIQVTCTGSNETLYINSTGSRTMNFNTSTAIGDKKIVNFYAYSGSSRIYGRGSVTSQ